jgi:hypothetical protein
MRVPPYGFWDEGSLTSFPPSFLLQILFQISWNLSPVQILINRWLQMQIGFLQGELVKLMFTGR